MAVRFLSSFGEDQELWEDLNTKTSITNRWYEEQEKRTQLGMYSLKSSKFSVETDSRFGLFVLGCISSPFSEDWIRWEEVVDGKM